jgi:hypothetical protein
MHLGNHTFSQCCFDVDSAVEECEGSFSPARSEIITLTTVTNMKVIKSVQKTTKVSLVKQQFVVIQLIHSFTGDRKNLTHPQ